MNLLKASWPAAIWIWPLLEPRPRPRRLIFKPVLPRGTWSLAVRLAALAGSPAGAGLGVPALTVDGVPTCWQRTVDAAAAAPMPMATVLRKSRREGELGLGIVGSLGVRLAAKETRSAPVRIT